LKGGTRTPVSAKRGPRNRREIWQLLADKGRLEKAIREEKDRIMPDEKLLFTYRAELQMTKEELRTHGSKSNQG
jgi:hypothetical protein